MSLRLIALVIVMLGTGSATAATVAYTTTSLGGSAWRYDYTVTNDSLSEPLREITVYFDLGLYENLAVVASPSDWDSLVVQPDPGLPAPGFFDSLALESGLAPGASQSGFAVSFDYLGNGVPGSQFFEVLNPNPFQVIGSGNTALVPAPGAVWLLGTAGLAVVLRARRRRHA